MPARTWPCREAYSNASGLSGSVTGTTVVERCSGKASIGSMTNEKCLKYLSLLYVSNRMRFNKDCKGSRGVFKCVRHSTNMVLRSPGMSGQTLSVGKILGVKSFKLYYVTVPPWMDDHHGCAVKL
ncbi:hypothetical protein TNCV_3497561 [Trichonephila clavipes]|nr:hypothetical protein TNCV_3497561 [Trichonephila clavipes]